MSKADYETVIKDSKDKYGELVFSVSDVSNAFVDVLLKQYN